MILISFDKIQSLMFGILSSNSNWTKCYIKYRSYFLIYHWKNNITQNLISLIFDSLIQYSYSSIKTFCHESTVGFCIYLIRFYFKIWLFLCWNESFLSIVHFNFRKEQYGLTTLWCWCRCLYTGHKTLRFINIAWNLSPPNCWLVLPSSAVTMSAMRFYN